MLKAKKFFWLKAHRQGEKSKLAMSFEFSGNGNKSSMIYLVFEHLMFSGTTPEFKWKDVEPDWLGKSESRDVNKTFIGKDERKKAEMFFFDTLKDALLKSMEKHGLTVLEFNVQDVRDLETMEPGDIKDLIDLKRGKVKPEDFED